MSQCMVYTIDKENMVVDQFECDRELAIREYHNQRTSKGRYFIANLNDIIAYKWRRKPLRDVRHSSVQE